MRLSLVPVTVLLILALAGCFRPAGDALPPDTVDSSVTQQPIETTPLATTPPLAVTTPTLPPVTIISPAERPTQVFGQPLDAMTPTPTLAVATSSAATPTTQSGGSAFITPGVPMGLVTLVLPTSTPVTSVSTPSGLITPTALGSAGGECAYVVQAGDNLFRIAVNNDVTLEDMRAANPDLVGDAPVLQPGQVLQLPNCAGASAAPTQPVAAATSAAPPAATANSQPGTTYVIQPGDTLFSIATRFGITVQDIVNANNLTNPDRLSVGQQLIIPASGG